MKKIFQNIIKLVLNDFSAVLYSSLWQPSSSLVVSFLYEKYLDWKKNNPGQDLDLKVETKVKEMIDFGVYTRLYPHLSSSSLHTLQDITGANGDVVKVSNIFKPHIENFWEAGIGGATKLPAGYEDYNFRINKYWQDNKDNPKTIIEHLTNFLVLEAPHLTPQERQLLVRRGYDVTKEYLRQAVTRQGYTIDQRGLLNVIQDDIYDVFDSNFPWMTGRLFVEKVHSATDLDDILKAESIDTIVDRQESINKLYFNLQFRPLVIDQNISNTNPRSLEKMRSNQVYKLENESSYSLWFTGGDIETKENIISSGFIKVDYPSYYTIDVDGTKESADTVFNLLIGKSNLGGAEQRYIDWQSRTSGTKIHKSFK